MTIMADFLLQPASNKAAGTTASRDTGRTADAYSGADGQDFSRVLRQQRQAADVRPLAAQGRREPARPAEQPRLENRQSSPPERKTETHQGQDKSTASQADTVSARQKDDSTLTVQEQSARIEDEALSAEAATTQSESTSLEQADNAPGALDPLLEQIMLAKEHSNLPGNELQAESSGIVSDGLESQVTVSVETLESNPGGDDAVLEAETEQEQVEESLVSLPSDTSLDIQPDSEELTADSAALPSAVPGQIPTTGSVPLETAARAGDSPPTTTSRITGSAIAGQDNTVALTLESSNKEAGLSLEPETSELSRTGSLLATSGTRLERPEPLAQNALAARDLTASEARTDALLRSEAVQSAQTAKAVTGQPLNMQQPGWSKELTDKVMWMSSQNLKSAEIKLNPAELGRLDIRVQVGQEHTQITFTSPHAGVRDSLEGQAHRLRELLEQQGMHNVDVEVADHPQQQQQQLADGRSSAPGDMAGEDEELVGISEIEQQERGHAGLVSYYV